MKKVSISYFINTSAIIWGVVLISCAVILRGTPYKEEIDSIIGGGIVFHFIIIQGSLANQLRKNKIGN